jgi:hypothetical protein
MNMTLTDGMQFQAVIDADATQRACACVRPRRTRIHASPISEFVATRLQLRLMSGKSRYCLETPGRLPIKFTWICV